ncbi:hypothetical protein CPB84DRAFT_600999 [Gymnopilus junonius]|uniref:Uncharacterized protein n=1 Tax=Gymnopilus junonius TaxID=109634 RepID=A0A9P5NU97_GYMJU|nr:hypothetical protein CPB84DRAFT_600999 [Gymnopilus junonius]
MLRSPLRLWSNLLFTSYCFLNLFLILNASSLPSVSASSAAVNTTVTESSSLPIFATAPTNSTGLDNQVTSLSKASSSQTPSGTSLLPSTVPSVSSKVGALPTTSSVPEASTMTSSHPSSSPSPKDISSQKDTPAVPVQTSRFAFCQSYGVFCLTG